MEEKRKRKTENTSRSKIFGSQRKKCREGKHFGLWGKVQWRRKREKIYWKLKMSPHQTSIEFYQNLQIQRPGIPVDR